MGAAAVGMALAMSGARVSAQDAKVERGKYLVEEVARCQECHTARTADNGFDQSQWLKGTTLIGVPATPPADWHQKSPDISSTSPLWQRWGDAGFSTFLQTAKNPRGGKAGPPMPSYMMKAEDADAIVAYLKTVK
jgi:mono/diheme cytochrome c family protein